MHISINNLIINNYLQKKLHKFLKEITFNKIREIWGCILEALLKNLHLFIYLSFFWVWQNLKKLRMSLSTIRTFALSNNSTLDRCNMHEILPRRPLMNKSISLQQFLAKHYTTTADNKQGRRQRGDRCGVRRPNNLEKKCIDK